MVESGSSSAASSPLVVLHTDARREILLRLDADALAALTLCCHELQDAASEDSLWRQLCHARHNAAVGTFFMGALPEPPEGTSWRRHAANLEIRQSASSGTWLHLARQRSGRLLVRMHVACTMHSSYRDMPFYGVPWHLTRSTPEPVYAVFDLTDFAPNHPGSSEMLEHACESADITCAFDTSNHSGRARRVLRALVVPGFEHCTDADALLCRPLASAWSRAAFTRSIRVVVAKFQVALFGASA